MWDADDQEAFNKIRYSVSEAALYEQLAEECTELAKAALKKSRKLRNENYTPKTMDEIEDNIVEELTDVNLICDVLDIYHDWDIRFSKLKRWVNRIEQAQKEEKSNANY